MNKDQVLELLKAVSYPGFSRDIVSFGMVHKITVDNSTVTVSLKITTQNEDKKIKVKEDVESALKTTGAFTSVSVVFTEDAHPPPQPSQQTAPEPAATIKNIKHIIAVASGKGGVGKSTIAANLALALSEQNLRVGLLDLDIYGPSLPIIFGINKQPQLTQDKKLVPIDHYGIKVMSFGFISGNNTPVIWRGPLVARMTEQFFNDVEWGELDFLILDLPPGTGDVQLTLTQKLKMDGALIITTPQDIALADVKKGADMFRKVHTPVLGVIENMSGLQIHGNIKSGDENILLNILGNPIAVNSDGSFNMTLDLFKRGGGKSESKRLEVPLLGEIPIAPEIMKATDSGKPILLSDSKSTISDMYREIGEKVRGLVTP